MWFECKLKKEYPKYWIESVGSELLSTGPVLRAKSLAVHSIVKGAGCFICILSKVNNQTPTIGMNLPKRPGKCQNIVELVPLLGQFYRINWDLIGHVLRLILVWAAVWLNSFSWPSHSNPMSLHSTASNEFSISIASIKRKEIISTVRNEFDYWRHAFPKCLALSMSSFEPSQFCVTPINGRLSMIMYYCLNLFAL